MSDPGDFRFQEVTVFSPPSWSIFAHLLNRFAQEVAIVPGFPPRYYRVRFVISETMC